MTALLLVLCVAAGAMWVRGYWLADIVEVSYWRTVPERSDHDALRLMSGSGVVALVFQRDTGSAAGPPGWSGPTWSHETWLPSQLAVGRFTFWQRVGFNWINGTYQGANNPGWTRRWRGERVPYWFVLLVTAALPGARLVAAWRTRRRAGPAGACAVCGYDLRATPDRCPECGTRREVR